VTVQKILDEALSTILNDKTKTTGAGRTDAGVHARIFCAHFDSPVAGLDFNKRIISRLNRFLPKDISVSRISKVIPEANARFSAVSRTYRYYISTVKDPFLDESSWFLNISPDLALMNEACNILYNHTDFTSFSKLHTDVKTNNCRIISAGWRQENNSIVFTIKADRFLRNMVRAIVGTMLEIGRGKISVDGFEKVVLAKDRTKAGRSVPAKGLFLEEIEYPAELFL